jgi:uridine kinase
VSLSQPAAARVILLTGPSGSGKSSLAALTGLPVLRLDDFYKEGDDPTLPLMSGGSHGSVDWDSAASWNAEAAMAAVRELCATGRAAVPVYEISTSSITGEAPVDLGGAPLFIAEGIFAADIVAPCRELGLLADALCLSRGAVTTARRRFVRDLREGRKSVRFLARRGWSLMRAERTIVARHAELGAYVCGRGEALERIRGAGRVPEPEPVAPVAPVVVEA